MTKHKESNHPGDQGQYPCLRRMPLSTLRPADYNPRTISPEALGRLTKSLAELGNLQPVTYNVRSGTVVGGHQRLKCLAAMGTEETDVWCVDLSPEQEKAANLTLNVSSGEWDDSRLVDILRELQAVDVDLDLTGFAPTQIADLLTDPAPPEDFTEVDESIPVEHRCPKCGYAWSGKTS
ncbi:MAG: ParB N-terminal domain-containing protein [Limisphaerales bacterium]